MKEQKYITLRPWRLQSNRDIHADNYPRRYGTDHLGYIGGRWMVDFSVRDSQTEKCATAKAHHLESV